jgi:hypothetical protein
MRVAVARDTTVKALHLLQQSLAECRALMEKLTASMERLRRIAQSRLLD